MRAASGRSRRRFDEQYPPRHASMTDTTSVAPSLSLTPGCTADIAELIRDACHTRTSLRIQAGGSWLDAGNPVVGEPKTLDLRALSGIVEYNPGDLTLTARAATSLAEIDAATHAHGQWLPLDPRGSSTSTLGATLATASTGPLASALGLPRDLALGLEFVDGRGVVARGGGRVVKNVAGFDLVRLMVGAWGTLGVITEVTVRLRARPEHECTLVLEAPTTVAALASLLRTLREAPITAIALELVDASLAATVGATGGDAILVRLAGNRASLAAQRRLVESFSTARELAPAVWTTLQTADAPGAASVRLSQSPSRLAELWHDVAVSTAQLVGSVRQASVERGIVRIVAPASEADRLATLLPSLALRWNAIGERLSPDGWRTLSATSPDRLSAGVRDAFDPMRVLNPGVLNPSP